MQNSRFETLEASGARRPYLDYWSDLPERLGITGQTEEVDKARNMADYLNRLTENVVHGADLTSVSLMPDIFSGGEQLSTLANGVEEWDRSLGSLNRLGGAQGDMLRAAGLLLRDNFMGNPGDFQLPSEGSDRVDARFIDLLSRNFWELQTPNRHLLLIGQLIHKAAWLETNPIKQDELFEWSVEAYSRLFADNAAPDLVRLMAGQYQADIYHEWLRQELAESLIGDSGICPEDIQDTVADLLGEQIASLRVMAKLANEERPGKLIAEKSHADEVDYWPGFMLEAFTLLALRVQLLTCHDMHRAAVIGARRAFTHEDQPRNLRLKPKTSFDIVIQRHEHESGEVITTPVQLKALGRLSQRPQAQRPFKIEQKYAVPVMCVKRCSAQAITDALSSMEQAIELWSIEKELRVDNNFYNRVQRLLARLALEHDYNLGLAAAPDHSKFSSGSRLS